MRRLLMVIVLMAATITAYAQRTITGKIVEDDSKEGLAATTVRLLKSDSTMVSGVLTDANGLFTVKAPADGK